MPAWDRRLARSPNRSKNQRRNIVAADQEAIAVRTRLPHDADVNQHPDGIVHALRIAEGSNQLGSCHLRRLLTIR